MPKKIETLIAYYRTKLECKNNLKRVKGNKSIKFIGSFNREKLFIITNLKTLGGKKRIVVNAFQSIDIAH